MLRNAAAEHEFEPFPVSPWTFNAWLENADGQYKTGSYYKFAAVSAQSYSASYISEIRRNSGFVDSNGNFLNLNVFEYNGNTFVKRTVLTSGNNTVILDPATTLVRFRFSYNSTSGETMTQQIINNFFDISVKRR